MLQALRNRLRPMARILMICALAAMSARALTPPGYMAARTDGGLAITLCGSGQAVALDLGTDGDHPSSGGGDVCPFAAVATAAPPPLLAVQTIVPPYMAIRASKAFPSQVAWGQGLAAPPPQSHAPPALI